jgi:hypothetical protein
MKVLATAVNISGRCALRRRGFVTGRVKRKWSASAQQAAATMHAKPGEECQRVEPR